MNDLFVDKIDYQKLLEHFQVQQIRPMGKNLKAQCPFHDEKTPSFFFYPENGSYYCFGCGQHGDIIDFVRRQRKSTFEETCQWLMAFCGFEGDWHDFAEKIKHAAEGQRFVGMMETLKALTGQSQVYEESLLQRFNRSHRDVYYGRGFTDETLDHFEVGYGLDPYEQGRLFFPIRNEQKQLVGLSARRIEVNDSPKWIHSSDLKKKQLLFHLHSAKEFAILNHTILVVEGPVDCMRAYQAGVGGVVGLLGHQLSDPQTLLLMKYAHHVILGLDADAAGTQGATSLVKKLWGSFRLSHLPLPTGKDVGDLTEEQFRTAMSCLVPIVKKNFYQEAMYEKSV